MNADDAATAKRGVSSCACRRLPRRRAKASTVGSTSVLDWASWNLSGQIVLARVRPRNEASQAVARRIGLRRDPPFDDQGKDGLDWAFTNRPL